MTWGRDWPLWAWFLVDTLAVYRLTRLGVKDEVTRPARRKLVKVADRNGGKPYDGALSPLVNIPLAVAAQVVMCPWCLSVYVAAAVVPLTYFLPFAWAFPAFALALSAFAGLVSSREA